MGKKNKNKNEGLGAAGEKDPNNPQPSGSGQQAQPASTQPSGAQPKNQQSSGRGEKSDQQSSKDQQGQQGRVKQPQPQRLEKQQHKGSQQHGSQQQSGQQHKGQQKPDKQQDPIKQQDAGQQQQPGQQQQSRQQQQPGQQQQSRQQQTGQQQGSQQPPGQQQSDQQQPWHQQSRQQQPRQQQQQQQQGRQQQSGQQQPWQQQSGQQQGWQQQSGQQQPGQKQQGWQQQSGQQQGWQEQPRQQQSGQQQPRQQQSGQQQGWQQQSGQQQPDQQQQSGQQQSRQQQPGQQQQQQGWQQPPEKQKELEQQSGQAGGRQKADWKKKGKGEEMQQSNTQAQTTASSRSSSTVSVPSSTSKSASGISRGTVGQKTIVETNYLRLNLDKMPSIAYHYDVTITPERPKKFMRPAFDKFNLLYFKDVAMAFDGKKSVYTIEKLACNETTQDIELADSGSRTITFKVCIKETDTLEVDLSSLRSYFRDRIYDKPMRALQCLEVVLASPCHNRGVRVGRSFFTKPSQFYDLNDGYEMWTGLYQAAILGDQPFLNVDISHKSFPSECQLIDYLTNTFRGINLNQPLEFRTLKELRTFLRSVNIVYTPPASFGALPKTYRVNDVSNDPANKIFFTLDSGEKLSVAQYFASKKYNLKYPNLNCLHVGSTVKNNYVPLEFCKIASGQALNRKDGPRQVQQMIKHAATSTQVRKEKIMAMLQYYQHNSDSKIQRFGIRIDTNFIDIPMRLLSSPNMEYFERALAKPFNGSWRMGDSMRFIETKKPNGGHKWALINSKRGRINYHTLQNLAGMLASAAKRLNMSLDEKPEIIAYDNLDATLKSLKQRNFDLVICLLPNFGVSYADIKQSAELRHGILTQCIKENTVERRLDQQLILNLLLKINAKLNGTNHRIEEKSHIPLKNVMFIGADVTHPSPDQREIPSVVGVAASHDAFGACYNMQYRLQNSTVENIEEMESIFNHHLTVYFSYQKKYPDHVIYYRDGVSDGQFPIVKQNEIAGMRRAANKLRIQNLKITCIIVVKRHHTRFFPKTVNPNDRNNKFNNVPPGTVVDQVIVHPNEVQFFMVSHQSIQGTAKPTRYNVIVDDAKMDIDVLQKLTYNLCHLFPRCNRVVSYPAPAYLAHLVAYRGRVYIEGTQRFGELKREYDKRLIRPDFLKSNPMYFV